MALKSGDGAINIGIFKACVPGKCLEDRVERVSLAPPVEAFEGTAPDANVCSKTAPRPAYACDPPHNLHKKSRIGPSTTEISFPPKAARGDAVRFGNPEPPTSRFWNPLLATTRPNISRAGQVPECERAAARSILGSGLIDHIQKMTMAAIAMADMKVCAHRSYRVWMRRQSFSLPNMFSILWRFL